MEYSNITYRNHQKNRQLELHNASFLEDIVNSSNITDTSLRSLPSTSEQKTETEEEITILQTELQSAHEEVKNLSLENSDLKKTIEHQNNIIAIFKRLGISDNCINNISSPAVQKIRKIITEKPHKTKAVALNVQSTQTDIDANRMNSLIAKLQYNKILVKQNKFQNKKTRRLRKKINYINRQIRLTKSKHIHLKSREEEKSTTSSIEKEITQEKSTKSTKITNESQLKEVTKTTEKTKVSKPPKRVLILADQQGRGMQTMLQKLIGTEYSVTCIWKPGAKLKDVLSPIHSEVTKLTRQDYVIILGGMNDTSPYELRSSLMSGLNCIKTTNVIVCETPKNIFLREAKLNYEIRFICSRFFNTTFIDMNYSRYFPYDFVSYTCRNIFQEILRITYKFKIYNYRDSQKQLINNKKSILMIHKATQTEYVESNIVNNKKVDNNNINKNMTKTYADVANNNDNTVENNHNDAAFDVNPENNEISCSNITVNTNNVKLNNETLEVKHNDKIFFRE